MLSSVVSDLVCLLRVWSPSLSHAGGPRFLPMGQDGHASMAADRRDPRPSASTTETPTDAER